MKRIAFFDSKQYDIESFNSINKNYEIKYFESKLSIDNVILCQGFDAVCVFVNDAITKEVIDKLYEYGIHILALRCAGYNNVDIAYAYRKIHVVRVPAYSPNAIAEATFALILTLNRKIHKAYIRTRDHNFNLSGLVGFDLVNKTIGVIGTGKIGYQVIKIALGFGMNVLAYDLYPNDIIKNTPGVKYVELDELFKNSDIITLHAPLTNDNYHLINEESINMMKDGVMIINTSRGALIDSKALLNGLRSKKISSSGLDVYEEEQDLFFEDKSEEIIKDDVLSLLIAMPNVIVTSHQAYLTTDALKQIAFITLENFDKYFSGEFLNNEVCYKCKNSPKECFKNRKKNCW